MARPDKAATVERLSAQFAESNAAVLTEYRGLTVKDLKNLRRSLGDDATYAVAKNTLTKLAAAKAGVDGLDDQLSGPTAIAFISGDVANVAKGLRDFAKDNPLLVIKGGVMDGKILDADTVRRLADLESREVLLAKLAGGMKASMSKAAALFAAPLTQAAQTMGALQEKAAQDPSVIGGPGSPAADQEHNTAEDSAPEAADAAEATTDAADAASNE
ncbi:50S ribosomal protein L10 [Propionibacterium australiense]|uniref:Large ribosomal subunit protein uL10 n=1 Tax=Propionibacterium australiense TaxID=119981 RepID=A0A383S4W4_9ACTN|nr:50S ribosomal protein L10 [Propionibacterium australiense]RLP12574.1 50S ribosomal protein L10 [Propionibacterium australiense]SYZ32602.1 Ribosomal protein L10P [Propionibacterium australiense]VEH91647.1 50S ribosomal protein L10 [Propionibacterium australiense]